MRDRYIKDELLPDLFLHFFTTALITLFIFFKTANLNYTAFFVLGGIFIDLDHLIDYSLLSKDFTLIDFFTSYHLKSGRVYVFCHSWELNFILFLVTFNTQSHWLFFLSLGLSLHLMIDNFKRKNLLFYFLGYRFYKGFAVEVLLPEYKERFAIKENADI